MAISFVKQAAGNTAGEYVNNATLVTTPAAAGNCYMLAIETSSSAIGAVKSLTDTAGNKWTLVGDVYNFKNLVVYVAQNISVASTTITISFGTAYIAANWIISEWNGIVASGTPWDATGYGYDTTYGYTHPATTTAPTTQGTDVAIHVFAGANTNNSFVADTASNNFIGLISTNNVTGTVNTYLSMAQQYKLLSLPNPQTATMGTSTQDRGVSAIIVLKGATTVAPTAPTNLSSLGSNAQVYSSWTAVSGAVSYNVYRATVTGGPYTKIANTTATNYYDSAVTNGTAYFYVVTAVAAGGESVYSSQSTATPNLTLTNATAIVGVAGNHAVSLTWTPGQNAQSFDIYRAITVGATGSYVGSSGTPKYTDNTAVNGTTYYYRITSLPVSGATPSFITSSQSAGFTPQASAEAGFDATTGPKFGVSGTLTSTGVAGGRTNLPNYTLIFDDTFTTVMPEGQFTTVYGKNSGRANVWDRYPDYYPTFYGKQTGNGDHQGGDANISVVSGVSGASGNGGNVLRLRLFKGTDGKVVGSCPEPILPTGVKSQAYGRYEIRYKIQPVVGYYIAWLLWNVRNDRKTSDPLYLTWPGCGEPDLVEGGLSGGNFNSNLHRYGGTAPNSQDTFALGAGADNNWHTFVTEWAPGVMRVYMDGVLKGTQTGGTVVPDPCRMALMSESNLAGTQPAANSQCLIDIDYMAIWSYTPGGLGGTTRITTSNKANSSVKRSFSGSAKLSTNTAGNPTVATLPTLPGPNQVVATGLDGQIAVGWDSVSSALSYNVYRSTSPGTQGTLLRNVPVTDQGTFANDFGDDF